jgi:hypothetical protein
MMSKYTPWKLQGIYVVTCVTQLCGVAAKKAQTKGWKNVHVAEADACVLFTRGPTWSPSHNVKQ